VSFARPIDSRRYEGRPREEVLADLTVHIRAAWQRAEKLRRKW
jgi:hypothetical protein